MPATDHIAAAVADGWTAAAPVTIAPGQVVVRWTHPSGAIVDDNTDNLPADLLAELGAEALAEDAFVGNRAEPDRGWEQFATFAAAAAYALGGPAC